VGAGNMSDERNNENRIAEGLVKGDISLRRS